MQRCKTKYAVWETYLITMMFWQIHNQSRKFISAFIIVIFKIA